MQYEISNFGLTFFLKRPWQHTFKEQRFEEASYLRCSLSLKEFGLTIEYICDLLRLRSLLKIRASGRVNETFDGRKTARPQELG